MALVLSSGVSIRQVGYEIQGNGLSPIVGNVDVTERGASLSLEVGNVPAGQGYAVSLTAVSADGAVNCAGSSMFDITAGRTSIVTVMLQCRNSTTGGTVTVVGGVNECPSISSVVASRLMVNVGQTVSLSANAVDPDGMPLTYRWTTPSGVFADDSRAATSYTCAPAGTHRLTLTVSDGQCEANAGVDVTCVAVASFCGNGIIEDGEQCDPPTNRTCDAHCRLVPAGTCGDGVLNEGEQCDAHGLPTASCDVDCMHIPRFYCGDGVVNTAFEQCDDVALPTATCGLNCLIIAPRCGDGVVNQPSEQCDAPLLPTATCTAGCLRP